MDEERGYGPSDVNLWIGACRAFSIAMFLIGTADSEHLEAYSDYIKDPFSAVRPGCMGHHLQG